MSAKLTVFIADGSGGISPRKKFCMASKRCFPTRLYKDPDFALLDRLAVPVLFALIAFADDEGREHAHVQILMREVGLGYTPQEIEAAMQELLAHRLIVLYQAGPHRYFSLTRWSQWQSLGGRITPSKYPAPSLEQEAENIGECSGKIWGKSGENPSQFNLNEDNLNQDNLNVVGENHENTPMNVVPFPTSRADADTSLFSDEQQIQETTLQVAAILKLPVSPALERLVIDYWQTPHLSLLGEAYAARQWIDDQVRNHKQRAMSSAFFFRWLKREQEALARRNAARAPTATTGEAGRSSTAPPQTDEDPYRAFLERRVREVQQQYSGGSS